MTTSGLILAALLCTVIVGSLAFHNPISQKNISRTSSPNLCASRMTSLSPAIATSIEKINALITTDAGGRGMKNLVVDGDLLASAEILARLQPKPSSTKEKAHVIILTGFPCCVEHTPPMETDGLASVAIANAVVQLGYEATIYTEECNAPVFRAAVGGVKEFSPIQLVFAPSELSWTAENDEALAKLAESADLVIACERAGPAADGVCYTMRGIDMNAKGLIAPLHKVVTHSKQKSDNAVQFIAIGDGGNELGMGKVIDKIHKHIPDGDKIGAVMAADHLVAASVSNWGGYALIAAAALVRFNDESYANDSTENRSRWIGKCLPTEESETRLLHRCVAAGCRDGVSGKMEATEQLQNSD